MFRVSMFGASIVGFVGTTVGIVITLWRTRSKIRHRRSLSLLSSIDKKDVEKLRLKHFAKSLTVSYANTGPLMIVEGKGARLTDSNGVSYLDTRNNVAHVGHCHPTVVQAVQTQVAKLNTNSRYLHPIMTVLASRLAELLPDPLEVVFFCNSGSEANDLALRLAKAYSYGHSNNTIVVGGAYHGHTLGTLEISPYKYEHGTEFALQDSPVNQSSNEFQSPGRHIWKVPCPDTYRGRHRNPATAADDYAEYVQEACQYFKRKNESVRAFIIEGGMSVAGVILPPTGYLSACVKAVREAGGIYIADEVQTGFGRLGTSLWAFQHQQYDNHGLETVIPDIVTVGKPFGNGMPLAALITSRKVADAFDACGVEYFNTFGGNPVCAAAGMAVLDVMDSEQLQAHALNVGFYLREGLVKLRERIHLIGDIRGSGLFIGVELVLDQATLEPATLQTSFVCSVLKTKYHILTSIDGPHNNVLVIKPPLCFSEQDADFLLESLAQAATVDLASGSDSNALRKQTPT